MSQKFFEAASLLFFTMKNLALVLTSFVLFSILNSCVQEDEIDTEKPEISVDFEEAFPVNCDTLYFGETYTIKVLFTDNAELGSYSIDIHHNFDHHSHTTEVNDCDLDEIKDAVNTFTFIQDYSIQEGLKEYETGLEFSIPSSGTDGTYQEGDYHFFVSLVDKQGWSSQMGLSIKILH